MNPEDRNKTPLTIKITGAAALYLSERGFKPVETEVGVAPGWIADLAGVCVPTISEAVKMKLIPSRPRWYDDKPGYEENAKSWNDKWIQIPSILTASIEVKTSRGDFFGDRKWNLPRPTNFCYLAIPAGLVLPRDYPPGWGILLCHPQSGDVRKCDRQPAMSFVSDKEQLQTVLAIATRRDHHTRYARRREFQRAMRVENSGRKVRSKLSDLALCVLAIVKGEHGSVDGALDWYGLREIPDWTKRDLQKLWGGAGSELREGVKNG